MKKWPVHPLSHLSQSHSLSPFTADYSWGHGHQILSQIAHLKWVLEGRNAC